MPLMQCGPAMETFIVCFSSSVGFPWGLTFPSSQTNYKCTHINRPADLRSSGGSGPRDSLALSFQYIRPRFWRSKPVIEGRRLYLLARRSESQVSCVAWLDIFKTSTHTIQKASPRFSKFRHLNKLIFIF